MLGLPALVDGADVVGAAVLFGSRLYDFAHQLPVVQVIILQLFDVNVGVLFHVLAVVDDLGESAAFDGVAIVEISQSVSIFYCRQVIKLLLFDSCIIIAIDDGRVDFAKVRGTVCLVADAVGRDILIFDVVWGGIARSFSCGTNRSTGAFSINVCVDNGIAGAAVDVDVTSSATVSNYNSANCRAGVTGSIIWAVIRTNGIDCIYGAAGDVDGCCDSIDGSRSSDCGMITGTDSGNVGILFNIDREIRSIAIPAVTNGATLVAFCRYGSISGDRNSIRAVVTACVIATSNCSVKIRTSIDNSIVRNGDAVSTAGTTADPGTRLSKGSNMGIAFNADVLAGTVAAAANGSSAILSGNGSDITAGDGNIGRVG